MAGCTVTLDDLRQALCPPDRQVYCCVRDGRHDGEARLLLHRVKAAALEMALAAGFSAVILRAMIDDLTAWAGNDFACTGSKGPVRVR